LINFQLHLVVIWTIFIVSAIPTSAFVTRMANTLRERELTLAQVRESEMRKEQLVAIGTLAVGTGYTLVTPLPTMSVLLTDLDNLSVEEVGGNELKEDSSIWHG